MNKLNLIHNIVFTLSLDGNNTSCENLSDEVDNNTSPVPNNGSVHDESDNDTITTSPQPATTSIPMPDESNNDTITTSLPPVTTSIPMPDDKVDSNNATTNNPLPDENANNTGSDTVTSEGHKSLLYSYTVQ